MFRPHRYVHFPEYKGMHKNCVTGNNTCKHEQEKYLTNYQTDYWGVQYYRWITQIHCRLKDGQLNLGLDGEEWNKKKLDENSKLTFSFRSFWVNPSSVNLHNACKWFKAESNLQVTVCILLFAISSYTSLFPYFTYSHLS